MYNQEIVNMLPGVGGVKTAAYRHIWLSSAGIEYLAGANGAIDGAKSRDPLNTGTDVLGNAVSDITTLRAGLLMGKITASGKYATSIIGVLTQAYGGAATTLYVSAATAAEIVRRFGATGTFKLTGPATAGSTVRTLPVTYSAVNTSTGALTIAALQAGATSAVNAVQTLAFTDNTGSGTFTLSIEGLTTAAITYSATPATLKSNIQAALDAVLGANGAVVGGSAITAITLTFSGTGYAGRPVGLATIDSGSLTNVTVTASTTTAGVAYVAATNGAFVSGALVQPTDGSETIRSFIDKEDGIKVTCEDTDQTVQFPRIPVAGQVDVTGIANYPSDTALQAYVKAALKTAGQFIFSDDV